MLSDYIVLPLLLAIPEAPQQSLKSHMGKKKKSCKFELHMIIFNEVERTVRDGSLGQIFIILAQ